MAHPKETAVSEDVDHAVDVGFAGEVESGADVSAGTDDYMLGEPGVQTVVDVRDFVGEHVVQVGLNLVQERVADGLGHFQLLFLHHSILLQHTTHTHNVPEHMLLSGK